MLVTILKNLLKMGLRVVLHERGTNRRQYFAPEYGSKSVTASGRGFGCQNRSAGVRVLLRVPVREGGQIERIVMAVVRENMVDFQFLHVCSDDEVGE